jgi:hypothetical protein
LRLKRHGPAEPAPRSNILKHGFSTRNRLAIAG